MNSPAALERQRSATSVEEHLDAVTAMERRAAFRALLAQPLLSAHGTSADRFALVRRHADWLREWLAANCGWGLHLDSEFARLQKSPADVADGTRGACEPKTNAAFSRRKYVILCLALASLERGDRQTTLGNLAKEVIALVAADAAIADGGIVFDLSTREQRSDLVQVIRFLLYLRVLERIDGDEQEYLRNEGDVLYNVNRSVLAMMLNVRNGPSSVDSALDPTARMKKLIEDQRPDTDDARNRELRFRLTRRLLDDPVIYFDDLDAEELEYLTRQRGRLLRRIESATGLIPEVRLEGIAMLDDRGDMTDLEMPKDGTEGHITLLIAEYLAQRLRDGATVGVAISQLHEHARGLIAKHSSHWKKTVREHGAEQHLVADAIRRLEGLALVKQIENDVVPRPAIARYGLAQAEIQGSSDSESLRSLQQGELWEAKQ